MLIRGDGGTGRPRPKDRKCEDMNFKQIVHVELKKYCVSILTNIRNITVINETVIATPTNVPEGRGWRTLEN